MCGLCCDACMHVAYLTSRFRRSSREPTPNCSPCRDDMRRSRIPCLEQVLRNERGTKKHTRPFNIVERYETLRLEPVSRRYG